MAKFHSDVANVVFQDAEGVWARFVDHEFETTDKKVIDRLKGVEGVTAAKATKGSDDEPAEA